MNPIVICLFASSAFDKAAQGLAGEGRRLANEAGIQLGAIVVGAGAEVLAGEVATIADSVILADQAELSEYQPETCLAVLTDLCRELKPGLILLSNDTYSQELAPRLAYRLGGSAVGDGTAMALEGETVFVTRPVYGGNAQARIQLKRSPGVVWLRSRSFTPAAPRAVRGDIRHAVLNVKPGTRARIMERRQDEAGQVSLEEARVIIAGGRGIGGPEPFATELRPLADKLGGELAASRAACDAGWVPATWQVGQTGKKVAPELYFAVGISGSSQHMAGVSEAKNIVAINTDPDAPIFRYCRLGVVADYHRVIPLLRAKLNALGK